MTVPAPFTDRLVALAATPDDESTVATDLIVIAQLAADRLTAVSYASVTSNFPEGHVTVAASSDLAVAVDQAQYADDAGPCLEALTDGRPVAVPDVTATMAWPRFRHVAAGLGLRSSLSLPLFAGHGTPVAALNLYSRDPGRMLALIAATRSVYEGRWEDTDLRAGLGVGDQELIAGLLGAFAVRAGIQQAVGVVMAMMGNGPDEAYVALRARAAEDGVTLTEMAGRLTSGQRW